MKMLLLISLVLAIAATSPAQPTSQPSGHAWTPQNDADLQAAMNGLHSGDSITLHSGFHYTKAIFKKGVNSIAVQTDGVQAAYFDVGDQDGMTLLLCDGWSFRNVIWTEPGRNPGAPGFAKKPGFNGTHLIQCNDTHFVQCSWLWWFDDFVAEGVGQRGPTFDNCYFGPSYAVRLPGGQDPHSQGVFLDGQAGCVFNGCVFYLNGWNPRVSDPAAAANFFCHSIYSKSGKQDGPYTATNCTFIDAASCGPTADTGATLDSCVFVNCQHDGGARNAFVGGPASTVRNCVSVGGSIDFIAKTGKVTGNTVFCLPGLAPYTLDIPHGHPNPRVTTDSIEFGGNVAFNWTGDPLKVWVNGGALNSHDNASLSASDYLCKLVVAGANKVIPQ